MSLVSNYEMSIKLDSMDKALMLFGEFDENIKQIEGSFSVDIVVRENEIKIIGEEEAVEKASRVIDNLLKQIESGEDINSHNVFYTIDMVKEGKDDKLDDIINDIICVTARGRQIKSKTLGQKLYIKAIKENDIVFAIGPAGTGKTYLAMAMAVNALKNREVGRIVLTRPAVEAGERLGYLPGDLQEKVDPYLRPIYDALYDIIGPETFQKHMEKGFIEVAPLAYMRGRTLDDSFIILDEAQNTTSEQMKMFLTRMGFGSKMIITGDITQIDLPNTRKSGLKEVSKILDGIEGISFVYLTDKDVVRNPLVQKIVNAYGAYEDKKKIKMVKKRGQIYEDRDR
ncbi:PhoH family protein [Calorimonas adulescens]|uniref:PhoH-like protein n=2 Tax=Calorimonas adulescens TaxID=2606906 RepID=A0A5D8QCM6_9THEO|nr:PhoH family protein [Calorimonas adulescens]